MRRTDLDAQSTAEEPIEIDDCSQSESSDLYVENCDASDWSESYSSERIIDDLPRVVATYSLGDHNYHLGCSAGQVFGTEDSNGYCAEQSKSSLAKSETVTEQRSCLWLNNKSSHDKIVGTLKVVEHGYRVPGSANINQDANKIRALKLPPKLECQRDKSMYGLASESIVNQDQEYTFCVESKMTPMVSENEAPIHVIDFGKFMASVEARDLSEIEPELESCFAEGFQSN